MKHSLKSYTPNVTLPLTSVTYAKFTGYCDANKCGELFLKYMEEQRDRQMGVDFSLIDTSNGRRQTYLYYRNVYLILVLHTLISLKFIYLSLERYHRIVLRLCNK